MTPRKRTCYVDLGDLAYIKLHKCASTSISSVLDREVVAIDGRVEFGDKKVFSAVRNPYDRLVSCWASRIWLELPWKNSFLDTGIAAEFGFRYRMKFDAFVKIVCEVPDEEAEAHFTSMGFLVDYFVGRDLDFYLQTESLQEDWKRFGLGDTYPKMENVGCHMPWQVFYNRELADMVYDRYRKDFETFGYDKEKY